MISNDSSVIINPATNEDEEKCKVEKSKSEEKRRRDQVENDDEDDDEDEGEEEDDDECNDVISPPFSSPDSPSSNNSIGSPPSDTSSFISSKGGKNHGGRKSHPQKLQNNRRRYKTSLSTLESDSEDLNHSSSSSGTSTLNSGASLNLVHGAVPSIPSDLFLTSLDDNYITAHKANAIKPPRKSSMPVVRTRSFSQPTQKAPSSQSSSSVKISSGSSGHKSLGSIKEVINSPSSGPHGLRFYINHPSCNSPITTLSQSNCNSNKIAYGTKSLGRKHHCRQSEEKCSSLVAIGNRPKVSAINTNGLPNVPSYCTLIRSRITQHKSRCHVQTLPSVPDQNEGNTRSNEASPCESNQSLFQQAGTRIKLSVSSGASEKGSSHLESSKLSSLNDSSPKSEPEPASFSIYSDINDFKELFTSTNDVISANVEKDIFSRHQLQKPLASIISNSVFWADSEDELIESQVEEPDIDNFTSDDDQLSEIAAARRLGNDCVGVLPTGCHRHPHHASLPPARLMLDRDNEEDEGDFQTKGADSDDYLSSLLQDDWSKQTEAQVIANTGVSGNRTGLLNSLGALWEDVEVQRQRNLRYRSKSSQRRPSPELGRRLPALKSGFNLAKSMDGLLLREPSLGKPSSNSVGSSKSGGGISSNVKRFSSALSGLNLAANSKILRRHTTYVKGPKSGADALSTTTTTTSSPSASNCPSEGTQVSSWQSSSIERPQTRHQAPHVHSWHRNRISARKGEEFLSNHKVGEYKLFAWVYQSKWGFLTTDWFHDPQKFYGSE